jgi:hypothetical protein
MGRCLYPGAQAAENGRKLPGREHCYFSRPNLCFALNLHVLITKQPYTPGSIPIFFSSVS